jgi:hypothetical protein
MPIMRKYENYTQQVMPKKLFGWEDGKFEQDYLEWLERAWEKWKGQGQATIWDDEEDANEFVRTQTLRGG